MSYGVSICLILLVASSHDWIPVAGLRRQTSVDRVTSIERVIFHVFRENVPDITVPVSSVFFQIDLRQDGDRLLVEATGATKQI